MNKQVQQGKVVTQKCKDKLKTAAHLHNKYKRNNLNAQLVREIFYLRESSDPPTILGPHQGRSKLIARLYGVSPKAIRDVWNFRTWRHVTRDMPTPIKAVMNANIWALRCVTHEPATQIASAPTINAQAHDYYPTAVHADDEAHLRRTFPFFLSSHEASQKAPKPTAVGVAII